MVTCTVRQHYSKSNVVNCITRRYLLETRNYFQNESLCADGIPAKKKNSLPNLVLRILGFSGWNLAGYED